MPKCYLYYSARMISLCLSLYLAGVRDSARYLCNQDWHRDGTLASFNFLPSSTVDNAQIVMATHHLVGDVHNIQYCLNGLRQKLFALKWVVAEEDEIILILTHCGLVTPYGDIDLCQHWFITWTNVDFTSAWSCGIHLRALAWENLKIPISKTRLKIAFLKLHSDLRGTNELTLWGLRKMVTILQTTYCNAFVSASVC